MIYFFIAFFDKTAKNVAERNVSQENNVLKCFFSENRMNFFHIIFELTSAFWNLAVKLVPIQLV
jgi:hypothetical protein